MGGVEQDGGERGGHEASVLQTNTAAAASSQSVGWSSFTLHAASCFCRGLRFLGSLERNCNSFMVFIPSSITRCGGKDRRVEEYGGRLTGRGRWWKISVGLETSAMQTDTAGVASSRVWVGRR